MVSYVSYSFGIYKVQVYRTQILSIPLTFWICSARISGSSPTGCPVHPHRPVFPGGAVCNRLVGHLISAAMFLQRQTLRFTPAVRAMADVRDGSGSTTLGDSSWFLRSSLLLQQTYSPGKKPATWDISWGCGLFCFFNSSASLHQLAF